MLVMTRSIMLPRWALSMGWANSYSVHISMAAAFPYVAVLA